MNKRASEQPEKRNPPIILPSIEQVEEPPMDAGEYYAECMENNGRIREVDSALLDAAGYVANSDYEKMKDDADRGEKIKKARKEQSEAYSKKRQAEWKKYIPKLNQYFERNPTNSLTDARTACATEMKVSLKTIERRTRGYKKPI